MNKLVNRLGSNVRSIEIAIGIVTLIKGLWLYHDRRYFFYPPKWQDVMNNQYIDIFIALVGLALVITALLKQTPRVRNVIKTLLLLCGVIMLFIGLLQLTHGMFTPEYRMGHSALGDIFIFYIVVLTAGNA